MSSGVQPYRASTRTNRSTASSARESKVGECRMSFRRRLLRRFFGEVRDTRDFLTSSDDVLPDDAPELAPQTRKCQPPNERGIRPGPRLLDGACHHPGSKGSP